MDFANGRYLARKYLYFPEEVKGDDSSNLNYLVGKKQR